MNEKKRAPVEPRNERPTFKFESAPFADKGMRCANCQSKALLQNGTCHVCMNCGTTTGCS